MFPLDVVVEKLYILRQRLYLLQHKIVLLKFGSRRLDCTKKGIQGMPRYIYATAGRGFKVFLHAKYVENLIRGSTYRFSNFRATFPLSGRRL